MKRETSDGRGGPAPALSRVEGCPPVRRADAAAVSSRTIEEFLSVDKSIDSVNLVFFAGGVAEAFLKHQAFSG